MDVSPTSERIFVLLSRRCREQVLWFLVCFGFNMVVFLPLTLRQGTRTLFSFSKYCQQCSTLTHVCQASILLAWKRNQNIPRCGSLRKICKRLPVFGSCTGASQIRRRFDWLCKLWQGKSRPHAHHAPKGRAIHPRLRKDGAFWPVDCKPYHTLGRSEMNHIGWLIGREWASVEEVVHFLDQPE